MLLLSAGSLANESHLFPVFRKHFQNTRLNDLPSQIPSLSASLNASKWKPIGNDQYQIDAGQKKFGMTQCAECGMNYSVHEPEDELLHLRFHNSINILTFKVVSLNLSSNAEAEAQVLFNRDGWTSAWCARCPSGESVAESSTCARPIRRQKRTA